MGGRRAYRRSVAILPVGSVEWHCGAPLEADTLIAVEVAKSLAASLEEAGCNATLLPPVYYGASSEWDGYAYYGVDRLTLAMYLEALLASIASQHEKIVVVNGHGGNAAVVRLAVERIVYDRGLPARIWVLEWWRLLGHKLGHMDAVEASLLAGLTGSPQPICECRGFSEPYEHIECRRAGEARVEDGERLWAELREKLRAYASSVCRA